MIGLALGAHAHPGIGAALIGLKAVQKHRLAKKHPHLNF